MGNAMFKRALVPVNNSDLSARVATKAAELVEQGFVKSVVLFSVWEADEIDYSKLFSADKEAELKAAAQAVLDKYQSIFIQESIAAQLVRVGGDPADLIIHEVEKGDYDLIIMGSRRLNKAQELIFGSVSDRVTRLISVPVLIIK
jgi:nucleotide-binding universal stress UspA family protein